MLPNTDANFTANIGNASGYPDFQRQRFQAVNQPVPD